jgi:uncharacterized membrane protein
VLSVALRVIAMSMAVADTVRPATRHEVGAGGAEALTAVHSRAVVCAAVVLLGLAMAKAEVHAGEVQACWDRAAAAVDAGERGEAAAAQGQLVDVDWRWSTRSGPGRAGQIAQL